MTLGKDLTVLGGAGERVEVILPILCPSDLLDHLTRSPPSSGIGSLVLRSGNNSDFGAMGWQQRTGWFALIINLTLLC